MSATTLAGGKYARELKQVEGIVKKSMEGASGRLKAMLDYLAQGSGKMLRPRLLILAAGLFKDKFSARERAELVHAAAAVELIHTASLVHDDIIDGAARRRGQVALHRRWGEGNAVQAGDYLLAAAFKLLSVKVRVPGLLPLLAETVRAMCRGELEQMKHAFDWQMTEKEYFRLNYLKTGQLLAACCEAGGRVMNASPEELAALRRYGAHLGQEFQLMDDLLDYAASSAALGKPAGSDLSQGVVTLPLIRLLQQEASYRFLLNKAGKVKPLPRKLTRILREAIAESGALDYCYRRAVRFRAAALEALLPFKKGEARRLLAEAAFAVTRQAVLLTGHRL
ncbi:MAG TPA: polyprenyl synthetase family protein [Bacillota bacterium]|jgi:heptaprenyl diphosphate synthase|nr:polyprenyl synthetase family protein [Bacillota bacterium]HOB86271.1 polyprenyl synthetase family protein [Bacillota bacterium]HOP69560.1 polyprenyl synthetase family protein [Bacillota bacterium]HPT34169.1 polyprenyl synthetase family protein [Bacillota bacterium]HQD05980.1 polyprenyl synthetase family protein [Bacillota bacterium]